MPPTHPVNMSGLACAHGDCGSPLANSAPLSPGKAQPNAVLAAVAAAPPGTVKATILSDHRATVKAFAEADMRQVMGSAWKFTADYGLYLGQKGLVTEVNAAGAVKITLDGNHPGTALWFPAGAVANFLLPASWMQQEQQLAAALQQCPSMAMAQTLMDVVRAYPQLSELVLSKVTSHSRGYSSPGYSSSGVPTASRAPPSSPPVGTPAPPATSLAERTRWNCILSDVGSLSCSGSSAVRTPPLSHLSTPPVHATGVPSALSTPASLPDAMPQYPEPVSSPKHRQAALLATDDSPDWSPSVSIVEQVIDDIFDKTSDLE